MEISRRTFLGSGAALGVEATRAPGNPPNILFLLSDDQSHSALGCYGNPVIQTPHLDGLARRGVRFEHCYAASSQCSPNRSAILTGSAPHTTLTSRLHTPMPPWQQTFLEPLRERGYFLGAYRKVHQGVEFDKRWDFYRDARSSFDEFFEARPKERPFFLHIGFTDPHRPYMKGAFDPPHDRSRIPMPAFLPDTPEVREDLGMYYDFTARMDRECGALFDLLRQHRLERNTVVFFTSDNGMPFPRAKGTCYDPGIRIPLLSCWPGVLPEGVVRRELISHFDLAPTFCDVAGASPVPRVQGQSFWPLLMGGGSAFCEAVFSERNWHDNFDPSRCVRTDRFKLILNAAPQLPYRPTLDIADSLSWKSIVESAGRRAMKPEHRAMLEPNRPTLELYDLLHDPNEFDNLAGLSSSRKILEELKMRLSRWMQDTYDFLPPGVDFTGGLDRTWPLVL